MCKLTTCGLTALAAALSLFIPPEPLLADAGALRTREALRALAVEQQLFVGAPDARAAIEAIVARAAEVQSESGGPLLPAGTAVDSVEWAGHIAEIRLTLPTVPDSWYLAPLDVEALALALGEPFRADPTFAGTRIRVRVGCDGEYGTLEQLMLPEPTPPPAYQTQPAEQPAPLAPAPPGAGPQRWGPTVQAARQPTGALTGVTVFASAGHGWTAGDASWYLQRPVLLDMCEDYGNIDVLNYFVAFAYNAGATVVPFRPVGWQPIEIVLDNDDPGVTFTGSWNNGSSSKYYENGVTPSGIVYKWTSASTSETATARYTPNITVTGFYPVYCFTIASSNRTLQTYRVSHSGGISEVRIDHRLVGNGWIWLGDYYLEAGGDNYVEISNQSDEAGAIIADAIRWGGGMGDVVRPGPGTVSGYPRDEEGQRYWAHSELGNNAVGFDPYIWDIEGYDDGSDNVRAAAKWAREMNQEPPGGVLVDRWKRVHLEFHSNAYNGNARGQICLITDLGATTYQEQYATTLSNEVDADMLIMDEEFEHTWVDRSEPTYTSSYGAICTEANGNEFDATIVELAFHDNQQDAQLLRDCRVRAAMARSCVQGIIRFLNSLPDSQVPLAFAPDTPRSVRAADLGDGSVRISWEPPLSDGARGDPATGYVVYRSANGYGFGNPLSVQGQTSVTITDLPPDQTLYLRVAATNAGGESMPSEVLAVRRRATPAQPRILIVNGFDRLRRQINAIQTFTQPPDYAGDWIERQQWRRSNSFDYVVQHAEALAAAGYGFDSCSNEAVSNSYVLLGDYQAVLWILGTESAEDATLSSAEQTKITDFLQDGGGLFISGAELGYDLIGLNHGASFMRNTLQTNYVADDAGTFNVAPLAGSILEGLAPFDFDPANGAAYEVRAPDVLAPGTAPEALACLSYVGGTGGVAGVQYEGGVYHVVVFGFPFEAISAPAARAEVMARVAEFILASPGPRPFDYNRDGDVDLDDFTMFRWCFQGPDRPPYPEGHFCVDVPGEEDLDIDLADFALFQASFTGPQ